MNIYIINLTNYFENEDRTFWLFALPSLIFEWATSVKKRHRRGSLILFGDMKRAFDKPLHRIFPTVYPYSIYEFRLTLSNFFDSRLYLGTRKNVFSFHLKSSKNFPFLVLWLTLLTSFSGKWNYLTIKNGYHRNKLM